ncbi:hypothetical protein T4B_27 [Trichinella pseudospiralis]|uniref:Uncharacterized protein n=1 Tax=Trichinella pseudospiralis TaxID=6337 RepID=A0A0V1GV74_TRIPS|nr:hypothetical protein T4A_7157 [Trichinella pseudospiralis]KRZ02231.1 hypothetical protein T4B_27 [Trichinella pseudospiralis]KRZ35344.1 hypothetical protein T4C_9496 [Trichinella pseudospiralis]
MIDKFVGTTFLYCHQLGLSSVIVADMLLRHIVLKLYSELIELTPGFCYNKGTSIVVPQD